MNRENAQHGARQGVVVCLRSFLAIVLLLTWLQFTATKQSAGRNERIWQLQVSSATSIQSAQDARALVPGKPIGRELAEGQTHEYHITVTAAEYLHIVVEKRGVDVSLQLYGSGEQSLAWAHTPSGPRWSEELWWVADVSGTLRLKVNGAEKKDPAGHYEVRIEALRPATAQDIIRHRARQLLMSGWGLEMQDPKTAESLRQALDLYEESRSLFKSIGDGKSEGDVLNRLGVVAGFFLSDY
jgi:hypothetical protein